MAAAVGPLQMSSLMAPAGLAAEVAAAVGPLQCYALVAVAPLEGWSYQQEAELVWQWQGVPHTALLQQTEFARSFTLGVSLTTQLEA